MQQKTEYKFIINTALIVCVIPGIICLLLSLGIAFNAIFQDSSIPSETSISKALIGSVVLIAVSSIFFLPILLRKKAIILLYYTIIGSFIFISYLIAAFGSLLKVENPSMEFVILTFISSIGLWLIMVSRNKNIRDWVKTKSKESSK